MFLGSFIAFPSTVIHFFTRGIPVLRYSPIEARVVQLHTIQPTSIGSFPVSTTLPVV